MKSKLFLSLSFLTAVVAINASSESLVYPRWHKEAVQWMYKNPNGKIHPVSSRFAAKHLTLSQMAEAMSQVAPQSPAEAAYAQAWIDYAKTPVATTSATSKTAQLIVCPTTTQTVVLGAGKLAAGAAIAGATAYGAQKAYSYMHPKQEVQLTRFERAKLALSNGYNSSVAFVKANPKQMGAAAATVAVLGLGYAAYKNSDAIFGKSKAVTTVVETPKAPVFVTRKNLRD